MVAIGTETEVAVVHRDGSMVPVDAALPSVLPTDRLTESGMPVPAVPGRAAPHPQRAQRGQRRVGVGAVVRADLGRVLDDNPFRWRRDLGRVFLMGRAFGLFAILSHEAAHKLLFTKKRVNDVVGRWGVAYPAFVPLDVYRREPLRAPQGGVRPRTSPTSPLLGLPDLPASSLRRKLRRDATGESGWKNLKGLLVP